MKYVIVHFQKGKKKCNCTYSISIGRVPQFPHVALVKLTDVKGLGLLSTKKLHSPFACADLLLLLLLSKLGSNQVKRRCVMNLLD